VINKIIGLIPPEIDFGSSGLYLDGWLKSNIELYNKEMTIRMKTMIRDINSTFDSSNCGNKMMPKF